MFSSLKKWVQDVTVDLTPPPVPPQPSPSSPSILLSPSKSGSGHHYYYSTTPSHEPTYFSSRPSKISLPNMGLSRPISMENVPNSKGATTSIPQPASPAELDLSHLNREEQEHIANVLRRARAVDEQQVSAPPIGISSIKSSPASIVSASLSSSISSSSSTSTSSFNSEKPEKHDQYDKNNNNNNKNNGDDNEIRRDDEEQSSPIPEPTLLNVYRCQVCNRKQSQQENTSICLQCQENDEFARITQCNTVPFILTTRKSSSPIPIEFSKYENDKIYDNIVDTDQKLTKQNSPTVENTHNISHPSTKMMNDKQEQEKKDDEEKQQCQSSIFELQSTSTPIAMSVPMKTRINNLTEIDENDFFYQEPSPYTISVDNNQVSNQNETTSVPSYKIDECIEEDDNDERDHVKELEETIANLTRHFPVSSQSVNTTEINPIVTHLHQPSTLSVDNIDVDSILEMEIESPSATDERFIQSSSSMYSTPAFTQYSQSIPISVPILVNNRRNSLSRSSGVRENLTDLLAATTKKTTESYPSDNRLLQRTSSIHSKKSIPMHRQKRNLPSVPQTMDRLRLRRTNSESRFSLPAVPLSTVITNSNLDDESDLLEIDLNDPTGSTKKTSRSKTESEISNNNKNDNNFIVVHDSKQVSSVDNKLYCRQPQVKQLRDQTTNTPPLSSLNSTTKIKKKVKRKGSSSPNNTNGHHTNASHVNGQTTPTTTSPTLASPPSILLSSLPSPNHSTNRPKLQKSTSTEISYPFPVSKLILNRTSLNSSQRDGSDLGFRITGGHSIPHCMEVTACIEQIEKRHRNYNILRNAVQEGDEVLEVGGVPLRGKSALFVQNLMNSIQDEFEIVVRSQHTIPPSSPSIEIHKPEKPTLTIPLKNTLTVDHHSHRRHSVDTSQHSPTHETGPIVVKSQSSIMPLQANESHNVSEQFLTPTMQRKKSVSSKERLFSVESLQRTSSTRSMERRLKVKTPSTDSKTSEREILKATENEGELSSKLGERKLTSLSVTTPDNTNLHEDSNSLSHPSQRRRMYEHRNSLLPNDPGLKGSGSMQSIDRRNSNESDESDNLSQYFRSSTSRKSSLVTTNDFSHTDLSREHTQNTMPVDHSLEDASLRLKSFIKSTDEVQQSEDVFRNNSMSISKPDEKRSISKGSFKFLKKKTKSVDFPNEPIDARENDYVGDIELQIGHDSDREQLVIRIVQAKNLPAKDANGYSDPFVKVYLLPGRDQENKRRTKYVSRNLNPIWEHTVVYGNMHREELQYKMLEFTVWDYDRFKANDFIGQVTIDLKQSHVIDDKPHWYRLQALRSREEATNRGSSPRLCKMTSMDSSSSSTSNKNNINMQTHVNQHK